MDVNVLEEVVPHEGVVALWVVSRKACGAMAALSHARQSQSPPPKDVRGYVLTPRDTFREEPIREAEAPALLPPATQDRLSWYPCLLMTMGLDPHSDLLSQGNAQRLQARVILGL